MKLYRLLLFFAFFFLLFSCKSEGVKSEWKYMDGFHFGDILNFDNDNYKLKNDTLYNGQIPFAIVEDYTRTFIPGTENKLVLKNLKTGELGYYTDKGE